MARLRAWASRSGPIAREVGNITKHCSLTDSSGWCQRWNALVGEVREAAASADALHGRAVAAAATARRALFDEVHGLVEAVAGTPPDAALRAVVGAAQDSLVALRARLSAAPAPADGVEAAMAADRDVGAGVERERVLEAGADVPPAEDAGRPAAAEAEATEVAAVADALAAFDRAFAGTPAETAPADVPAPAASPGPAAVEPEAVEEATVADALAALDRAFTAATAVEEAHHSRATAAHVAANGAAVDALARAARTISTAARRLTDRNYPTSGWVERAAEALNAAVADALDPEVSRTNDATDAALGGLHDGARETFAALRRHYAGTTTRSSAPRRRRPAAGRAARRRRHLGPSRRARSTSGRTRCSRRSRRSSAPPPRPRRRRRARGAGPAA